MLSLQTFGVSITSGQLDVITQAQFSSLGRVGLEGLRGLFEGGSLVLRMSLPSTRYCSRDSGDSVHKFGAKDDICVVEHALLQ